MADNEGNRWKRLRNSWAEVLTPKKMVKRLADSVAMTAAAVLALYLAGVLPAAEAFLNAHSSGMLWAATLYFLLYLPLGFAAHLIAALGWAIMMTIRDHFQVRV